VDDDLGSPDDRQPENIMSVLVDRVLAHDGVTTPARPEEDDSPLCLAAPQVS
jgi:hypothetical protein